MQSQGSIAPAYAVALATALMCTGQLGCGGNRLERQFVCAPFGPAARIHLFGDSAYIHSTDPGDWLDLLSGALIEVAAVGGVHTSSADLGANGVGSEGIRRLREFTTPLGRLTLAIEAERSGPDVTYFTRLRLRAEGLKLSEALAAPALSCLLEATEGHALPLEIVLVDSTDHRSRAQVFLERGTEAVQEVVWINLEADPSHELLRTPEPGLNGDSGGR